MLARALSLIFWLWVGFVTVVFTILTGLSSLLVVLFDKTLWLPRQFTALWARAVLLANPTWRLTIEGQHNLPKRGAYILTSNHSSMADIVVLYHLPSPFKWLAKENLFHVPLLGWSMAWAGDISLVRENQRSIRSSFNRAIECLRLGVPIMVFPEGTRSRSGKLGSFKRGAFRLAIKAGVPIVPVAVTGTRDVVVPGTWILHGAAHMRIRVFPPIPPLPESLDAAERLRDRACAIIAEALRE